MTKFDRRSVVKRPSQLPYVCLSLARIHASTSASCISGAARQTYNSINPSLQYQNGIDGHIDWAASQFISKSVHVGLAGYFFQQITGDTGAGATLGDFKGRTIGIGPQIGFLFRLGESHQGYLNLRGYRDLATENRASGWTALVTFAISPAAVPYEAPKSTLIRK